MRELIIGIVNAENTMTVFGVTDKEVKTKFSFITDKEAASCTCVQYKLRGTCKHLRLLERPTKIIMGRSSVFDYHDFYTPNIWDIVLLNEDGNICLVSNEIGNLSAYSLIWKLMRGETEMTATAEDALSGERIYTELSHAFKVKKSLMDSEVIKLGKGIAPVVKISAPKTEVVEHDWKNVDKPSASKFWVDNSVWEQAIYCAQHGKNLLLTGPSGSGKSELCYLVAEALELPITAFNMGAMSEPRTSLIGNTHLGKDGTWFARSRFVNSVTAPIGIILLDEVSRAERGASNILLPLMDRQGYLALDESEDAAVVHRGEKVCFFATANLGMEYTGTDPLDRAMRERYCAVIDMQFPPQDAETKILVSRCKGLRAKEATKLTKLAASQRKMAVEQEGEFTTLISTRMLIAAGEMVGAGVNIQNAIKFAIENAFSSEGAEASERTKLKQIVQRTIV